MEYEAEPNGYKKDVPIVNSEVVKILVVGEPRCGKTKFIEVFFKANSEETDQNEEASASCSYHEDSAKVYSCKYEINGKPFVVKIFEIVGGPDEAATKAALIHTDTNGFILMYAIDDRASFTQIEDKWLPILHGEDMWQKKEPAILVGTKNDLRSNQQVIQRLAQNNETPVTEQEGLSLVSQKGELLQYYDCSATENHNVNEAFHFIVTAGRHDLYRENHAHEFEDQNVDDSDQDVGGSDQDVGGSDQDVGGSDQDVGGSDQEEANAD